MQRFAALILLAIVVIGVFLVYRYSPQLLNLVERGSSKALSPVLKTVPPAEYKPSTVSPSYTSPISSSPLAVKINYVYPKGDYNQYSQVSLSVSGGQERERIDISGWQISAAKGSWTIPTGTELYGDSDKSDIFLKSGDRANIYSHSNRLNANYRLNKCIGYIKNITPENYSSCPYVRRDEIISFSGLCQNYINSLGSCQVPEANPPVPYSDSACREFLSKLNYAGCVERYHADQDFYSNEWRIWETSYGNKETEIFDPYHGTVKLIDRGGKTVDQYIY